MGTPHRTGPAPGPPPDVLAAVAERLRAAGCVFAEDEARLLIGSSPSAAELDAMVERRAAGLPVEQVVGWAEFCGLRIDIAPGVFVPRRRTEFLARRAIELARQAGAGPAAAAPADPGGPPPAAAPANPGGPPPAPPVPVVVDLCCGSGAVGAAVAAGLGRAEVHAVDIDPVAVACAQRNLAAAGGHAYAGDLYQPLPARLRGRAVIVAVNPPYVPTAELALLPAEARAHEPRRALDGGADGLAVLRRAAAGAPQWLAPHGCLVAEVGRRQAALATEIFARCGLAARVDSCRELDATVVIGGMPGRR